MGVSLTLGPQQLPGEIFCPDEGGDTGEFGESTLSRRLVSRGFGLLVACALLLGLVFAPAALAGSIRFEDTSPVIAYTPPGMVANPIAGWFYYTLGADSGGSYTYNALSGASAAFPFTGTGVVWASVKAGNCGIAQVWVDSEAPVLVNLYNATTLRQQVIWSRTGLSNGPHTLHIVNTGTSDPPSGVRNIGIDYFDVLSPSDIVASAGSNGSVSPAGTSAVDYGASATYTIAPAPGYHVADVLVDGSSVGAVTSYQFINVTGAHTISASFAADPPVVSTPASSPWSMALAVLAAIGFVVAFGVRRRSSSSI